MIKDGLNTLARLTLVGVALWFNSMGGKGCDLHLFRAATQTTLLDLDSISSSQRRRSCCVWKLLTLPVFHRSFQVCRRPIQSQVVGLILMATGGWTSSQVPTPRSGTTSTAPLR